MCNDSALGTLSYVLTVLEDKTRTLMNRFKVVRQKHDVKIITHTFVQLP